MRTAFLSIFFVKGVTLALFRTDYFFFSFKKRTLKISIGAIIKDPGMLRLVHKHV